MTKYELRRREKGLTLAAASKLSGVSIISISNIETEKTSPTVTTLEKLAKAYEVELKDFF